MRAISARDAGLALISQIRRWLLAGALMLSGAFSLLAAQAFHGPARGTSGAQAADSGTAPASQTQSSGDEGSGLQQPAAPPAPAQAPAAPAPVVSGGS